MRRITAKQTRQIASQGTLPITMLKQMAYGGISQPLVSLKQAAMRIPINMTRPHAAKKPVTAATVAKTYQATDLGRGDSWLSSVGVRGARYGFSAMPTIVSSAGRGGY